MTLTLSALLNSKSIFLLVTGAGKFPILKRAMEIFCDKGNIPVQQWLRELPLRSVLHQYSHPVSMYFAE